MKSLRALWSKVNEPRVIAASHALVDDGRTHSAGRPSPGGCSRQPPPALPGSQVLLSSIEVHVPVSPVPGTGSASGSALASFAIVSGTWAMLRQQPLTAIDSPSWGFMPHLAALITSRHLPFCTSIAWTVPTCWMIPVNTASVSPDLAYGARGFSQLRLP